MNLTSLTLNKKVISNLQNATIIGGANKTYPLTKCKLEPIDTTTTFQPIPNPDDALPI
ncbi:hypothetical protein IMCC3317_05280 [Kordia antarctica]|uniref:Uncharacterized protein n=2 Tax=Kordia antarctica TaxID=1218801 RepID=A0A7L4ZEM2_9FLAO|nr:hypothetical protein IMCC3317_05280 [Kordia antarctica]